MTTQPQYNQRTFVVPANYIVRWEGEGDFLACLSASAGLKMHFDDGAPFDFAQGLVVEPDVPFRSFTMRNDNPADITVEMAWGRGGVRDARLVFAGAIATKEEASATYEALPQLTCAAGATTAAMVADTARREAILVNMDAATTVWVCDDAGGAAEGLPLLPNAGAVLATTAALWVHNPSGAAVTVARSALK